MDSFKSLMKLKILITKLHKGFFSPAYHRRDLVDGGGETGGAAVTTVPDDVKEGHFAVVAVNGGEKKRFVLDLGYLSNPKFLELLEQAAEEYGFEQRGVLVVPCPPEELQNVLKCKRDRRISTEW